MTSASDEPDQDAAHAIPDTHPRAASLRLRERLVAGLRIGIVTETGLVAHGRGEALDYLLGERTHPFAEQAVRAASARLLLATHPVFTVNGNVVGLSAPQLVELAAHHPWLGFEVNLFHYSVPRAQTIAGHLRKLGLTRVLERSEAPSPVELPGLDSARRFMHPDGVARADVVLVALEDGDRCQALVSSGRHVIAIDLNPLSRTARMAQISIVDELTRVLPRLDRQLQADRHLPHDTLHQRLATYDNQTILNDATRAIRDGFA